MHELLVKPDGTPTDLNRQVSHVVVGLGAAWAVYRMMGRRKIAGLVTFVAVAGAHEYFDAPTADVIAALA
jgi:hypothetical protein